MAGKTSNTSFGPSAGDWPKVNTAGKIITPANTATNVSSDAVVAAVRTKSIRRLK